ncbi:MAG: hypothetical protein QXO69_02220 [archaeon]
MRLTTKRLSSGRKAIPIWEAGTGKVVNKNQLGLWDKIGAGIKGRKIARQNQAANELRSDVLRLKGTTGGLVGYPRSGGIHPQLIAKERLTDKIMTGARKGKIPLRAIQEERQWVDKELRMAEEDVADTSARHSAGWRNERESDRAQLHELSMILANAERTAREASEKKKRGIFG